MNATTDQRFLLIIVLLLLAAVPGMATIKIWTGDGGANRWDNTSTNWIETSGPATPSVFNNNDAVIFSDVGNTNPVVNLTTAVTPASVTVDSSFNYTFTNSGGGSLRGGGQLMKTGSGRLSLRNANFYSGGTTLSTPSISGGIQLFDVNALGSGLVTIDNAAGLSFAANLATGNGGRGITNDIVLQAWTSGNTLSSPGKLSGRISGPGNWNWNGFSSGSLALSGNNTGWSGGLYLSGPITLYLGHTNALGSGKVTMQAGVLPVVSAAADLSGGSGVTNPIVLNGNPVTINLANHLLLSGPISGGSNLVKSGSATLILRGNNTFTGNLTNSAGTLKVGSTTALGAGLLTMRGGKLGTVAAVTLSNKIFMATGGEVAITNDLTLSGVVSGTGGLTKSGFGLLKLSSANSYSGGTTVNDGTLLLGGANALGTGVLRMNSGWLWFGEDMAAANGGLGFTNDIVLPANPINFNALSFAGKLSGKISGAGRIDGNGFNSGSLILSGDNSGWSGGWNITGDNTLLLGHTNALGTGPVTMDPMVSPVLGAAADLSGGLGVRNAVSLGGNSLTLNLTNDLLLSGPISGTGNLFKMGHAKLILGANNPHTGLTVVSDGTLAVNGILNASVRVASPAILAGTGTISGPVTVEAGGTLQPGSGAGATTTLSISNDVSLAGVTLLTINRANPQNASLVAASGRISYGGLLTVSNAAGPVRAGDSFTLFRAGSYADAFSATNLPALNAGLRWVWTPSNGTISVTGSALTNTLNVLAFGAKGDGVTDDTAAIQAALDYAAACLGPNSIGRAGAAVLIPSGTYVVTNRLTFMTTNTLPKGQGLTIRGEGTTNTILLSMNETGSGLLYFDLRSPVLNSGFRLQIEDLGLQSARRPSVSGAAIEIAPLNTNTVNVWPTFRAIQISGSASDCGFDYGVKATKLNRSIMDRVSVYGPASGTNQMTAGFYEDYCYGPIVRDCFVSGAQIGLVFTNGGEGTMVNRCTITNVDRGIYVQTDYFNYIPPSSFDGKVLNSLICANNKGLDMLYKAYFTVANNTFARQGSSAPYVDITMEDFRNSFISDNIFSGSGSGRTCIKLIKSHYHGEFNTVAENSFGAFDTGIWLSTALDTTRVLANDNLSSSAVVDYANKTFFQPVYTNWLRSPSPNPAAAPSEELQPWDVFRNGSTILNVADYGATGDGSTDDSAAVASAFADFVAELNSDRSAGLYFPAGTYKLSQTLKAQFSTTGKNAALFGEGINVTTIDWRGSNFVEWVDTGASATVIGFHHLRITTPSTNGDNVILSINQEAATGTNRSFRAFDIALDSYGAAAACFKTGIFGVGLKNPLFRNVTIEKYQWWTPSATHATSLFGGGLILTNATGMECEYLRLHNTPKAVIVDGVGGAFLVKNCHEFSVAGEVQINAGGGSVAIQGAHINSTNNLDISNASAVSVTDTLFLNSVSKGPQGILRLTACTNVIVRNNEFGAVDTSIPNPERFGILLGAGCQNVEIAGNHFGEEIGIIIPAGAGNVKAFENRFLYPLGIDILCQKPTAKILMLPDEANPELAAIWKLDEGSGTNVYGQSYSLDGNISGATWVAGKLGTALQFDGMDDKVTVAQYPEAFRYITTNFTVMAWVKPEKPISNDDDWSGQSFVLYPTTDVQPLGEPPANHVAVGVSVGTNRIKVVERSGESLATRIDYAGSIPSSEWTHVAVVYSNSTPRLIINGGLRATGSVGTRIPHPGCWGGESAGAYQGAMDDYRVYHQALSPADIVALGTALSKTWTGEGGNDVWDIHTTANWVKTDAQFTPTVFDNDDAVTFDAIGSSHPVVLLTTTVSPAAVNVNSASPYTFLNSGGCLAGSGKLTKLGSGRLNLHGPNFYTGGTIISTPSMTGNIQLFDVNALGSGLVTIDNSAGLSFGTNLATGNGGLGITNDILLMAWTSANALSSAGKLSGKISGPGNWSWNGFSSGSVTLSGDNSAWSGGFNFRGTITLCLGHTNALGTGTVTMDPGILPVLSAAADLSGGLGVRNAVVLSGNALTLNLTNDLLLSGPISGAGNLVKSGLGTLILAGANTYSGTSTIAGGKVLLNRPGSVASPVVVSDGATLGGNGLFNGAVTLNDGATLAPGSSAIGELIISNSLTLSATSLTRIRLAAPTNNAVVGLTTLTYGGALFLTNLGRSLVAGDAFKLFDADNYAGNFSTLVPAVPGPRLAWDMSTLASDGTLRVVDACDVSILAHPIGRAAVIASSISFTVRARTTTGVTNYQWRFEGLAIPGATNRLFVLNSVQATNFGAYSAVVDDGVCFASSSTAQLTQAWSPTFLPLRVNRTTVSLSFLTEVGPTYDIEYKDTLTNATWHWLNSLDGTGNLEAVTDSTAGSQTRFYRICVH